MLLLPVTYLRPQQDRAHRALLTFETTLAMSRWRAIRDWLAGKPMDFGSLPAAPFLTRESQVCLHCSHWRSFVGFRGAARVAAAGGGGSHQRGRRRTLASVPAFPEYPLVLGRYVSNEVVGIASAPLSMDDSGFAILGILKRLIALDAPLFAAACDSLWWRRPRVLLAWIVVVLAAALSSSTEHLYLLPGFPAMALLVAGAIRKTAPSGRWPCRALRQRKWPLPRGPGAFPSRQSRRSPSSRSWIAMRPCNAATIDHRLPDEGFYSACLDLAASATCISMSVQSAAAMLWTSVISAFRDRVRVRTSSELRRSQFDQRLRDWGLNLSQGPGAIRLPRRFSPDAREDPGACARPSEGRFPGCRPEWAARMAGFHEGVNRSRPGALLSREVVHRP